MPCPILGWELSKDYALTELTNSRWGSDKKEANKHLTQRKFWKKNRIYVQEVAAVGQGGLSKEVTLKHKQVEGPREPFRGRAFPAETTASAMALGPVSCA